MSRGRRRQRNIGSAIIAQLLDDGHDVVPEMATAGMIGAGDEKGTTGS